MWNNNETIMKKYKCLKQHLLQQALEAVLFSTEKTTSTLKITKKGLIKWYKNYGKINNNLTRVLISDFVDLLNKQRYYSSFYNERKKYIVICKCIPESAGIEYEPLTCVICMEAPVTMVYVPCGHAKLCAKCIQKWTQKCPICKRDVEQIIRLFA